MTVKNISRELSEPVIYTGVSGDTKPLPTYNGSNRVECVFYETDTGNKFVYDSGGNQANWRLTHINGSVLTVDYNIAIPVGDVPGLSSVNKFGNNPTLGTSATETIWDGSSLYTLPATADITHLRQAVDQATMRGETIQIQGLDTSYALVTQSVVLDAANTTTAVALGTALRRVFRMKALSAVVTTQNVELRNVGGGTTYALIIAGNNQTQMAVYTVPASKTAYITSYYCSLNKDAGGGAPDVVVKMWNQDNANTYAPQLKHILGATGAGSSYFRHEFSPYLQVTEKTDIYLNATNLSGTATADVSGGFDIILVDD